MAPRRWGGGARTTNQRVVRRVQVLALRLRDVQLALVVARLHEARDEEERLLREHCLPADDAFVRRHVQRTKSSLFIMKNSNESYYPNPKKMRILEIIDKRILFALYF